jgi:hypothetical protein
MKTKWQDWWISECGHFQNICLYLHTHSAFDMPKRTARNQLLSVFTFYNNFKWYPFNMFHFRNMNIKRSPGSNQMTHQKSVFSSALSEYTVINSKFPSPAIGSVFSLPDQGCGVRVGNNFRWSWSRQNVPTLTLIKNLKKILF